MQNISSGRGHVDVPVAVKPEHVGQVALLEHPHHRAERGGEADSTLSTSALSGTSRLPTMKNSRMNVATAMSADRPRAGAQDGRLGVDQLGRRCRRPAPRRRGAGTARTSLHELLAPARRSVRRRARPTARCPRGPRRSRSGLRSSRGSARAGASCSPSTNEPMMPSTRLDAVERRQLGGVGVERRRRRPRRRGSRRSSAEDSRPGKPSRMSSRAARLGGVLGQDPVVDGARAQVEERGWRGPGGRR